MKFAGFREVSQQEFYDAIGLMNVTPYPEGNWPYSSDFKTRDGIVKGKKTAKVSDGKVHTRYYLPDGKTTEEQK